MKSLKLIASGLIVINLYLRIIDHIHTHVNEE